MDFLMYFVTVIVFILIVFGMFIFIYAIINKPNNNNNIYKH